MLGSGGAVKLWVPAALAYGAEGDRTLGVGANETLYYEAELLDQCRPMRPPEESPAAVRRILREKLRFAADGRTNID